MTHKMPVGGAVPLGTIPSFDPPAPDPLAPVADQPSTNVQPHTPLDTDGTKPPHLGAGQPSIGGVSLLLLTPRIWDDIDRNRVQELMSQMLMQGHEDNTQTVLTALAAAMVGVIANDLSVAQWSTVLYDVNLMMQNQLISQALALTRIQEPPA